MINFKFVKSQFKNVWIPLVVFFVILVVLIVPALTQDYMAPTLTESQSGTSTSGSGGIGAMPYLSNTFFGPPGIILMFSFSLILSHLLVSKEVDKGYMSSWLTTPMSRKTILNSKLFILLSSILILYFGALVVQLLSFPFKFNDFNLQQFAYLLLYNVGLILLAVLWAAINWFFITTCNKSTLAISLASALSILFVVFQILPLFASLDPSVANLKYFKYATITSLLNSPFIFGPIPNVVPGDGETVVNIAPLLDIKALDFAWQLPVMFVIPCGLFPLGNAIFAKKDLSI